MYIYIYIYNDNNDNDNNNNNDFNRLRSAVDAAGGPSPRKVDIHS